MSNFNFIVIAFLMVFNFASANIKDSVMVGYFAEWDVYGRNYHVADIPADKLTHIIYAFAKISPAGEVDLFDPYAATEKAYPGDNWDEKLRGNFKQLKLLKQKHPHLKTLIAIGGWTLSEPFSNAASTHESRTKLAFSAVNFMHQYGFDGIDIDWEYPQGGGLAAGRPEDKKNFTLLMEQLRDQLNRLSSQTGKTYLLTVASPAGDQHQHYELDEVAKYIDWYNLMAYDYHGAWEKTTNHQSPLYANSSDPSSVASRYQISFAVNSYLQAGVPAQQIVLGIPLYSRGWAGVSTNNNGLFQPARGACKGTWESGILDYGDLAAKISQSPDKYVVFWDAEAKVSYVFNPYEEGGTFYTYDDVRTAKEKAAFIKSLNLRGAMFWEVSGDLKIHEKDSIINVVYQELGY